MKNVVSAMFVAGALSAAVGVAAQEEPATATQQPAIGTQQQQPVPDTQTPAAPTEQRAATPQRPARDTVTISGCIQNAPAQAAAGAATSASPAGSKYVLANAKAAAARGNAVGTTGSANTATRYRLDGEDKTISPHLNHQVEITGTVETSASATGAANAAAGSAAAGPMLKVESVKMVSATCQQQ